MFSDSRPVLYLDVDGVLVTFERVDGQWVEAAAPHAREFFAWASEYFEVRWLTAWAPQGFMREENVRGLALLLETDEDDIRHRPVPYWRTEKTDGICWLEHLVQDRPFVWIEDGLTEAETRVMDAAGMLDRFIHVDVVQEDPDGLLDVMDELARRFDLPLPDRGDDR